MKNKRLATVLRFLSCYCIAMGCVTIFSLFEIVFEDKTEGILWGTAITILVVTLLVWNSRLSDDLGKRGIIALLVVRIVLPVLGAGLFVFDALHYIPQTDVAALLISIVLSFELAFILMNIWLKTVKNVPKEKADTPETFQKKFLKERYYRAA